MQMQCPTGSSWRRRSHRPSSLRDVPAEEQPHRTWRPSPRGACLCWPRPTGVRRGGRARNSNRHQPPSPRLRARDGDAQAKVHRTHAAVAAARDAARLLPTISPDAGPDAPVPDARHEQRRGAFLAGMPGSMTMMTHAAGRWTWAGREAFLMSIRWTTRRLAIDASLPRIRVPRRHQFVTRRRARLTALPKTVLPS